MTRLGGMKLSEFNAIVNQMKGIYPFKDDEATICNVNDPRMGDAINRLEIYVKDKTTGIDIVMSKDGEKTAEGMF